MNTDREHRESLLPPQALRGLVSGLIIGFFGPWIWAPITVGIVVLMNVFVFACQRRLPRISFLVATVMGVILGFLAFFGCFKWLLSRG